MYYMYIRVGHSVVADPSAEVLKFAVLIGAEMQCLISLQVGINSPAARQIIPSILSLHHMNTIYPRPLLEAD